MWPNSDSWSAGYAGTVSVGPDTYTLTVVDCGTLKLPTGKLGACDPFVGLSGVDRSYLDVPVGEFPVSVTIADVSPEQDASHFREAYVTVRFSDAPEQTRRLLRMSAEGTMENDLPPGEFYGFGVDAGTVCMVDAGALKDGVPEDVLTWDEEMFQPDDGAGWFDLMDDPEHIREGLANLPLPRTPEHANILIAHSGWGDGVYPVVGGYAADGQLVAVHIDLMVVFDEDDE